MNTGLSVESLLDDLNKTKTCPGNVVVGPQNIDSLRFCETIAGSLTFSGFDAESDFSSLKDLRVIQGDS